MINVLKGFVHERQEVAKELAKWVWYFPTLGYRSRIRSPNSQVENNITRLYY